MANIVRSSLWCLMLATAACAPKAPPAAAPPIAGPTCEAGECNTRGMEAVALARYDVAMPLLERACTLGHAVGLSLIHI